MVGKGRVKVKKMVKWRNGEIAKFCNAAFPGGMGYQNSKKLPVIRNTDPKCYDIVMADMATLNEFLLFIRKFFAKYFNQTAVNQCH